MHYGKLDGPNDTAAKRVYGALDDERMKAEGGRLTNSRYRTKGWLSSWELATAARTPCPGTRVSEVRAQLSPWESIEVERVRNVWYYRLVRTEETGDE